MPTPYNPFRLTLEANLKMLRRLAVLPVIALIAGCGPQAVGVEIPFVPVFGERIIGCGASDDGVSLSDLRLYVANPALLTRDGDRVPLELEPDGRWQQQDLALLDFETGADACENGTAERNLVLRGSARAADYVGLQFTIGVPFDRNHQDPLQAAAPLGDPAMHWHWRGGYKFLRAGLRNGDDSFWIHLGSTGCEGTVQNISGCRAPNRVAVRLDDFRPGEDTVAIDLAALADQIRLHDGVATSCASGPAEPDCAAPFAALGLEHGSGLASGVQRVFQPLAAP